MRAPGERVNLFMAELANPGRRRCASYFSPPPTSLPCAIFRTTEPLLVTPPGSLYSVDGADAHEGG